MALIDFEVHNNEMQERNVLIKTARELLLKARESTKAGSRVDIVELSKGITQFLNSSDHAKYEYNEPKKEFK
jgi:hypothetical protein